MTHPITPVKLGGWEHLCERGKKERGKEEEEEKRKRGKKRGDWGGGREAEGSRIRRELRKRLI